jgi:hypothetical protein
MPARASKPAFQRRTVQLVQLRRGRIDHQVLRRALGKVAAGVRQGLKEADTVRAHGLILCLVRLALSLAQTEATGSPPRGGQMTPM